MNDICYITYDPFPITDQSNESDLMNAIQQPDYRWINITKPLIFNVKLLFNINLNDQDHHQQQLFDINLNFLRIILCFHHETSLLGLFTIFLSYKIISFLIKNSKCNESIVDEEYSITDEYKYDSNKKNSFNMNEFRKFKDSYQTTKYYKIKKIFAGIIIFTYLIEISIILSLYKYDIFGEALQYFCSNFLSFVCSLFVIYYMFANPALNRQHQKFICFYWLISMLNFFWNILSIYIQIDNSDYSIWKLCSKCQWHLPNFQYQSYSEQENFHHQIIISNHNDDHDDFHQKINIIWLHFNYFYAILFSIQFFGCFLTDFEHSSFVHPESNTTLFGRTIFIWMSRTIFRGYRRPLTTEDIFKTSIPVEHLEQNFFRRLIRQSNEYSKSFKLIKILVNQFGGEFLQISFIKLIPTLITFIGPLLLDRLIKFTTSSMIENQQPQWHGYFYAISMFILFVNESILNSYSDYHLMVLALKIRSCLMASIYRRLILAKNIDIITNTQVKQKENPNTSGQIVNLMSTDTQHIFEYIKIVNLFWICPLQIIIAIYLLWQLLGYGSLAGLGVLLLLLLINTFIGARIRSLQTKLLEYKDRRMKSLTETLNGIRAIKLYAWEEFFHKRIDESRRLEYLNLRHQALYSTAIAFAFISAPFFIALSSFSLFLYINANTGGHLDAQKAFVSLAIFNIIRRPVAFIPQLITNSMMFSVSLKRISNFVINNDYVDTTLSKNDINNNNPYQIAISSISSTMIKIPTKISLQNCRFTWLQHIGSSFRLDNIDICINQSKLCAIVGSIGSGKSSLLAAILGQMNLKPKNLYQCICHVNGKIAYVPQNSWIHSGTIRENILFGNVFDPIRYWKVIDACALLDDIKQMINGDKTLIGEKGDNLSGGQRQRISLARAVYADADIYLLDDPLSALDSRVSRHVFRRVISNRGLLANKIRLFTTNNMALLPNVDEIFLMNKGSIVARGNYQDLINMENEFTEFLTTYFSSTTKDLSTDNPINDDYEDDDNNLIVEEEEDYAILVEMVQRLERQFASFTRRGSIMRKISLSKNHSVEKEIKNDSNKKKRTNIFTKFSKITQKKESELKIDYSETITRTGSISFRIYWHYIRAVGLLPLLLILFSYTFGHYFVVVTNLWLSSWSNDSKISSSSSSNSSEIIQNNLWMNDMLIKMKLIDPSKPINQWIRLNVYAILGFGQTIFILIATLLLKLSCLRGSQWLHQSMLYRLMHAPIWFFDQANSGAIFNRFSKDIDLADTTLITSLRSFMIEIFRACALFTIIITGTESPILICLFLPLIIAYFLIYKYYVSTSRQLMRIESKLRTPIYQQFNETYAGVIVIQAFERVEMFLQKFYKNIDMNTSVLHMSIAAAKWLSVRLECLGNLVVLITSLSCVLLRGKISPGMVGLCITSSLTITGTLNFLIRSSIELENNIVTVERLVEYTNLPQEDEWYRKEKNKNKTIEIKRKNFFDFIKNFLNFKQQKSIRNFLISEVISAHSVPINLRLCSSNQTYQNQWPTDGSISFIQYSARYQNSSTLCLKQLNLCIPSGTKIGIVGRTGAGKSSFAMALFRLIEAETGEILISNRNIHELGLHELRSKLTIIPQDPLLFAGTLRNNLDPFNHYSDQQIIDALNKVHLGHMITMLNQSVEKQLNHLSFGQKQLLCLSRALLRKSKILLMDEATAGIDPATDQLIQETIRYEFFNCTVLTIAHRLKTILSYDQILVLDHGKIIEFDTPKNLMSNSSTLFYKMMTQ
ncbi:ATP-binding cassette sub-family C member 3-like [Dermatophagoides pteronyssinus]|uniref:ATP-binding cassette sub-family C member 3-like n=1 Tax=Dermatophagoides pteronyssinus TaxID=6956 RepID=UPI003F66C8F8